MFQLNQRFAGRNIPHLYFSRFRLIVISYVRCDQAVSIRRPIDNTTGPSQHNRNFFIGYIPNKHSAFIITCWTYTRCNGDMFSIQRPGYITNQTFKRQNIRASPLSISQICNVLLYSKPLSSM